jgi:uncharacterized coiled-coil protein SlyX
MNDNDAKTPAPKPAPRRAPTRLTDLEAQIDQRDETIRLLNEALSRALDELALAHPHAA